MSCIHNPTGNSLAKSLPTHGLVRDKEVLGWKVESGKEVRTIVGVEWRESMSFSELTRQGGVEAGRSGNGQAVNG